MHFVLVDEADSILIDEARTPLIIGSLGDETREAVIATYAWASEHADQFVLKDITRSRRHSQSRTEWQGTTTGAQLAAQRHNAIGALGRLVRLY